MPISPKARALIGLVTTVVFAVAGLSLLASQRWAIGLLLVGMALFRGHYARVEWRRASGADEG